MLLPLGRKPSEALAVLRKLTAPPATAPSAYTLFGRAEAEAADGADGFELLGIKYLPRLSLQLVRIASPLKPHARSSPSRR